MYREVIPGNLTEGMGEHCRTDRSWADAGSNQTVQSAVASAPCRLSVLLKVAERFRHQTEWVPSHKTLECPKCTLEISAIPASPWTMFECRGDCGILAGIHDYFCARREDGCFGRFFFINMQYLAAILEHLPSLCKWALPLLKHW